MSKIKRKYAPIETDLYAGGDKICSFELPVGKEIVKPGDLLKIKNQRGKYRFYKLVHNTTLDVTWVDVMNVATGEWRSFYVERVKAVIRPKRSYKTK